MKWIDKLDRKLGRYAIKDLMLYIIILNSFVFLLMLIRPETDIAGKLMLKPDLVLKGEVWRLFTYIFIPPSNSPVFIIFVLYFYYIIGSSLEHEWGSFKFNMYYLIGMICTTIAAFVTGGATATYLNLSLFLAFAYLYPDFEIRLFFILPIKVKYMGWFYAISIVYTIIVSSFMYKIAAIVSVLNFMLFFGSDFIKAIKLKRQVYRNRRRFFKEVNESRRKR